MFKIVIVIASLLNPALGNVMVSEQSFTKEACEAKLAEARPKLDAVEVETSTKIVAKCVPENATDL